MTTTAIELTDADRVALQLALELTLANDPPAPGTVEQVGDMLNERSQEEVAEFCCYYQQTTRLALRPWMDPPCSIRTRERAEAILENGPATVNGGDVSNCATARLTLDMLDAGVSPFHPDPIGAIAAARSKR
jgi:hypothetical protein